MKIVLKEISVEHLTVGFADSAEQGVIACGVAGYICQQILVAIVNESDIIGFLGA